VAKPYAAINGDELADGTEVEVSCASGTFRLPVANPHGYPARLCCLPAGLPP